MLHPGSVFAAEPLLLLKAVAEVIVAELVRIAAWEMS